MSTELDATSDLLLLLPGHHQLLPGCADKCYAVQLLRVGWTVVNHNSRLLTYFCYIAEYVQHRKLYGLSNEREIAYKLHRLSTDL